jgi:hypothetical protein
LTRMRGAGKQEENPARWTRHIQDPAYRLPRILLLKLSEKGYEQRSEHGFGRYKEGEGAEESVLGGPQSCAIDASEAFRTVSEEGFSEVRIPQGE